MANVLADLALESEAATAAAMRLARSYDTAAADEHERLVQRLLTPVIKFWTCKRAPQHAAEALECLGGNGFVEESPMPRLFRQSPLNGLWEGSGNVICLDVLRAMLREPESLDAFWTEVGTAAGCDRRFDAAVAGLRSELSGTEPIEGRARHLVERMALVFEAALLLRESTAAGGRCLLCHPPRWGRRRRVRDPAVLGRCSCHPAAECSLGDMTAVADGGGPAWSSPPRRLATTYRQGFLTPVRPTLKRAPLKPRASSEGQKAAGLSLYSALKTALCPT